MDFQIVIEMENTGTQSAGVRFKQNDSNIKLYFDIFENGQSINSQLVLAGNKVGVSFRRSDGVTVVGDCVLDSDYVYYDVKGSELACAGNLYMDLKIMDGDKRYSTQTLLFHVSEDTETDVVESASVHAEELFNAIDSVPGLIDDINTAGQRWIDEFPDEAEMTKIIQNKADKGVVDELEADVDELNSNLDTLAYDENHGGKNIFDESKAIYGYLSDSGTISSGTATNVPLTSDYIEIEGGKKYTLSLNYSGNVPSGGNLWNAVCFYDSNKTFISPRQNGNVLTKTYTAPSNAKYIRANVNTFGYKNVIQLEEGEVSTAYEPYIMSNHQLTEQNKSLDEQGLVGNNNIEIVQGYPDDTDITKTWNNTNYVCSKGYFECKSNDTVSVHNENSGLIVFFDSSKTKISEIAYPCKAPTNAKYYRIKIGYKAGITPTNCGNVSTYINNAIDELKADLSNTIWFEHNVTYDAWSIGASSGVKGKSTNVFALAYVTLTNDTNTVIYSTQYNAENGNIQFTSPTAIKNGTKMKVMCHFF